MKLQIERAILDLEKLTGEKMKKKELAAKLWPELPEANRNTRLSNLITGKTKRIEVKTLVKLCKLLGVDCNYMVSY